MTTRSETLEPATKLAHPRILDTLSKKVAPAHTALVVIDVQNDFCVEGGMMSKEGLDLSQVQHMANCLPGLITVARHTGVLVTFVRNIYSTATNIYLSDAWLEQAARTRQGSYTAYPVCREGAWEGEFYGAVRPEPSEPVVTKHRYSAFHNTDLETILKAHGVRTLVLAGVTSNVCVETTAREGFVRDYYSVFLSDGTASYTDEDHQATLRTINRYFGQVVEMETLKTIWTKEYAQRGVGVQET